MKFHKLIIFLAAGLGVLVLITILGFNFYISTNKIPAQNQQVSLSSSSTQLSQLPTVKSLHSKNPAAIVWEDGDLTFTIVTVGSGSNASSGLAIDIGLNIKNNSSSTITASSSLKLASGGLRDNEAPYEEIFKDGRWLHIALAPNTDVIESVSFLVPKEIGTFEFTAGNPPGMFFTVTNKSRTDGGYWTYVQEKPADKNDCTPVFLSGNFGSTLNIQEDCPVCVVTDSTSTEKTTSSCPVYPRSCVISGDISKYLKDSFDAVSVKNVGSVPKVGFDYQALSRSIQAKHIEPGFVAQGFDACDFQNVETFGGHYEASGTEVIFLKDPTSLASSDVQEIISDAGYKTLFSNIVWRLGAQNDCFPKVSWSKSCIDKIISRQLDNQALLEAYIKQKNLANFYDAINKANYCEVDSDCAKINDSCLYPCGGPLVNKNEVSRIQQLIKSQKNLYPGCSMADCVWDSHVPATICANHSCTYSR